MKKVSILVLLWFLSLTTFAQTSPNKYLIKYLESNTAQPDYGVTFLSDNQFIYKSPSAEKINSDSQKLSESNLFIATISDDGELLEKKEIQGIPTDKITKTGAAYSKDLTTVYFSAMKYRKKRKRNDREQLFKADVDEEGNWSNMSKLTFSKSNYSFGEPALSTDGTELYFTSDMPSSIGGADIFVVAINDDGSFGKVRNLGPTINTSGNEVTAYISKNNMLYFSSDGHPNGLGNLDVYVSDLSVNNIPTTPIHLDAPINSTNDDFSFISNNDKRGYFASNRLQGQNNHDIYSFLVEELIKDEKCVQEIVGVVKDKETELAITDAKIILFDDDNNEIQQVKTDTEGAYKFILDCNKTYTLKASGELYSTEEHIVNTANYLEAPTLEANKFLIKKTVEDIANANAFIAKAEEVIDVEKSTTSIGEDKVSKEIVVIENEVNDTTESAAITDSIDSNINKEGVVETEKDTTTIEEEVEEIVVVETEKDTTTESAAITNSIDSDLNNEDVVDTVTETSVAITEDKVEESIEEIVAVETEIDTTTTEEDEASINPVYFSFDKFDISAKAAKELDKIAGILNNNKNIHIEVSSYTDSRGSKAYNLKLSERRAKASADYLVSLGVDRSRITAKGYGESKMVNKCFDGVECSEAAHEKNRRTEFAFLNPQVAIETFSYESKAIKETEVIEEEVSDTITEATSVAKEEVLVEDTAPTYADTEESTDESFSELNGSQQSLTNLKEKEPSIKAESSKSSNIIEEVTAKDNTNPSTNKVDAFPVSQNESSRVVSNGLSEEEMEEVLSFQEDESSKEEEETETNEPESQRKAFNELIAEAAKENKQEEKTNKDKNYTSKIDNSVPNKLLSEISSQVVQPTTKSKVNNETKEKVVKKNERDETSLSVNNISIEALQSKKGKYIETDRSKKIHALRLTFRIKENYLSKKGYNDAFVVIHSPKGKVISEKGTFTLADNKEQSYTDSTTIFYNNQSIKIIMFIDKLIHKFTKGTYTVGIYIQGHKVGSSTFKVNS